MPTLQDFAYLNYDIVALYHGYNDLLGDAAPNYGGVPASSRRCFALAGYYPILPLALQEKAMALRTGGDLDAAYRAARGGVPPRVTFTAQPGATHLRGALEAVSNATGVLGATAG